MYNHKSLELTRTDGTGCLVFSFQNSGESIYSISLYAKELHVYKGILGKIDLVNPICSGKNKDPEDHFSIHQEFAQMSGQTPEDTMVMNRHFHWCFNGLTVEDDLGLLIHCLFSNKLATHKVVYATLFT